MLRSILKAQVLRLVAVASCIIFLYEDIHAATASMHLEAARRQAMTLNLCMVTRLDENNLAGESRVMEWRCSYVTSYCEEMCVGRNGNVICRNMRNNILLCRNSVPYEASMSCNYINSCSDVVNVRAVHELCNCSWIKFIEKPQP